MKIDKNLFVNFPRNHPVLSWVILVVAEYFITELLSRILKIPYRIYLFLADSSIVKEQGLTELESVSIVNINIGLKITVLVLIGIATAFFIYHRLWKTRFNDSERKNVTLQQSNDELKGQLKEKCQQIDYLQKEEAPYKEIRDMVAILSDFTEKSEVVDSIQLYQCTSLPDHNQLSPDQMVEISFRFYDGTASSKANVNALYNICYELPSNVYICLW